MVFSFWLRTGRNKPVVANLFYTELSNNEAGVITPSVAAVNSALLMSFGKWYCPLDDLHTLIYIFYSAK